MDTSSQDHIDTPLPEDNTPPTDTNPPQADNPPTGTTQSNGDELQRLQESLARSQADYQNLLMRVERDRSDMATFLASKILLPLLAQIDHLERAVKLKEGVTDDSFVDGVRSVLAGIYKYLELQ